MSDNKVLLVGWDAADWKVIHPLMDAGKMPHLKRLVESGVMGDIATLHPVLSPMLWTSIATGKRAYQHGVHGFIEPTADGMDVQPVSNLSRRCKAIWNILNQNQLKSIVVGWWPSHPAEPIDGVMVSNQFHQSQSLSLEDPWPQRRGTIYPPQLSQQLGEYRMHPAEITEELIYPFIPQAAKIDQQADKRLWMFCKTLAECNSIHAATTHLMQTQPWNLTAVYYDAIDHFSHGFMKYHPPRQSHISETDFEIFQHVISCAYVYHDMMLGRLLELAGADTHIILLSDHGFHPDHLRPKLIPAEPTGPAVEHRDSGIFVINGPGIKQDQLVHGVSLLDIAPTVLTLFDLPIGQDMDGRVIREAFETNLSVEEIPSWEEMDGDDGRHPKDWQLDPDENKQAIRQLVDLGYVEALDENKETNVRRAVDELNFNLARSFMDAHRFGDALELLYGLYVENPSQYRFGVQLAMCFRALDRTDDLHELIETIQRQRHWDAQLARTELQRYRTLAEKRRMELPEPQEPPAKIADQNDSGAGFSLAGFDSDVFDEAEKIKINYLIGLTRINSSAMEFLRGYTDIAQKDFEQGIARLESAATAHPERVGLHLQIGDGYLKLKKWEKARSAFSRAHGLDADNAQALLGLFRAYLGLNENQQAIEYGLKSVGQKFFNPMAHYYLGVAFHRIGKIDRAVDALKLSIHQNPNNARAHGRLGYIFGKIYGDAELAKHHLAVAGQCRVSTKKLRQQASQLKLPDFDPTRDDAIRPYSLPQDDSLPIQRLPTLLQSTPGDVDRRVEEDDGTHVVTVVTGLPRSGTSMMMQMLSRGGLPPYSDGHRIADEDNQKGYLEHDHAKRMANFNSWVEDAQGKVVKVVAQLVPYLPKKFNYRVIFMERPIEEVLASQKTMLSRNGQPGGNVADERLRELYRKHIQRCLDLLRKLRIPTFRVVYSQVLSDPEAFAEQLQRFLEIELKLAEMVQAVDPAMHRQRSEKLSSN